MAIIRKGQQQQAKVGKSIGERRELRKSQSVQQRPVARKPIDKFAGAAQGKNKKSLAGFAPNATFRQARRFSANGTPYKRPLHEHIEKGTAPTAGNKKPPSDKAILNFLDKVIDMAPQNARVSRSRPTQKTRTAPSKQNVQQTKSRFVKNPQPRAIKA